MTPDQTPQPGLCPTRLFLVPLSSINLGFVYFIDQARALRLRTNHNPLYCRIRVTVLLLTTIRQPLQMITRRAYGTGGAIDAIAIKGEVGKFFIAHIILMQHSQTGVVPPIPLIQIPAALWQAHHFRSTVSKRAT